MKQRMENLLQMMKSVNLYTEGDSKEDALEKLKKMSKNDWNRHFSKLKVRQNEEEARESGPNAYSWWFSEKHPERLYLLQDVLGERLKEDSEDAKGEKVYIKERCPRYADYLKKKAEEQLDAEKRRQRIIKENRRLTELGRQPIPVPEPFKINSREEKQRL